MIVLTAGPVSSNQSSTASMLQSLLQASSLMSVCTFLTEPFLFNTNFRDIRHVSEIAFSLTPLKIPERETLNPNLHRSKGCA